MVLTFFPSFDGWKFRGLVFSFLVTSCIYIVSRSLDCGEILSWEDSVVALLVGFNLCLSKDF